MAHAFERELETAIAAARRAARLCKSIQETSGAEALEKKDRSPVTVADFGSQALVCRELGARFPDDPIIGEENADALREPDNAPYLARLERELQASPEAITQWIDRGGASEYSDRFWTLDPIDGTKGFLRKEQYAVALALVIDGQVSVATLACPNLPHPDGSKGVLFCAVRGHGARAHRLFDEGSASESVSLRVSTQSEPGRMRFVESVESGHSSHDDAAEVARRLGIGADSVRLDSQAKYGVVARGDAEIYLRLPTRKDYQEKIWDHAAGALVVQEAGGVVTDVAGKPLEFVHGRTLAVNRGVVVSHGPLHQRIIETLGELGVK